MTPRRKFQADVEETAGELRDTHRTSRLLTPNLTFGIVEDLGAAVVSGRYSTANPLPVEAELCRHYGVSRPILREAVKMLTAKGLIGARPRQGTWIEPEESWNLLDPDVLRWLLERKYSPQLLIHFNEIRLGVEPTAAALAAERATPEAQGRIESALQAMAEAEEGRGDPLAADIGFHVAILRASDNPFYLQLTDFVRTALRFSITRTNAVEGRLASLAEHRRVATAISQRQPLEAHSAMQDLIEGAIKAIRKAASNDPSATQLRSSRSPTRPRV